MLEVFALPAVLRHPMSDLDLFSQWPPSLLALPEQCFARLSL